MSSRAKQFRMKIAHALVVAIALSTAPAFAQNKGEVLLSESENAYNPIPSPNGKLITYVRTG